MIEARDNALLNHWSLVANRLYYAVFHMASALMIDKGFASKTHSGLICMLGLSTDRNIAWKNERTDFY